MDDSTFIHPRFSHATWVAVAVGGGAILGAGASIYGANKQSDAIASSNAANQAAQAQQNNAAWSNYLMTRGIAPTSPVTTGVVPTAGNYTAVNTRLPLWANINLPTSLPSATANGAKVPFLIKKT